MDSNKPLVFISGATAGIGLATAKSFAKMHWNIAIGARRQDKLTNIEKELLQLGATKVFADTLDVQSSQSVNSFGDKCLQAFGYCPDVIINNAGMASGVSHVKDLTDDDIRKMIDTNVCGLLYTNRFFVKQMLQDKQRAFTIINIGSIAGHTGYAGGSVYCSTKHAVKAISESLRQELLGTPIKVSHVCPGLVETEFSEVRLQNKSKAKQVYKGMTPLTAQDIADTIVFIATRAPHVNIDEVIMMPTDQASAFHVHRRS